MARYLYAASPADYFVDPETGAPLTDASAPVEQLDGTAVTDLRAVNPDGSVGAVITVVSPDADGTFRYYGPDGYRRSLWLVGAGGKRFVSNPVDLAEQVADLQAAVTSLLARVTALETADPVADAAAYTNAAIEAHVDDPAPHQQYVQVRDSATGQIIPGVVLWSGSALPAPTVTPAPKDEDLAITPRA